MLRPKQIEEENYIEEIYKSLIYTFISQGLGKLVNCLPNQVWPICFNEEKILK